MSTVLSTRFLATVSYQNLTRVIWWAWLPAEVAPKVAVAEEYGLVDTTNLGNLERVDVEATDDHGRRVGPASAPYVLSPLQLTATSLPVYGMPAIKMRIGA